MKFKSGTEEEHTEKEQLCQDIYDCMSQFRGTPKKNPLKIEKENAKRNRDEWANLLDNSNKEIIVEADVPDHDYVFNALTVEDESDNSAPIKPPETIIIKSVPSTCTKEKSIPAPSKVLRPIRARKRKMNVQRQGLSYLEQYDIRQLEAKKQDQVLEERKICLEEKKVLLEERKMLLAEKKFNLDEYEKKKNLEFLEGRLESDIEQRKMMANIIERQDKIIEMLLSKINT